MSPFFGDGQYVRITEVNNIQLGDVVAFSTQERTVFHRVVLLTRKNIVCKGDNCLHFDWGTYDFGAHYRVVRHKFGKQVAILSRFWGNRFYRRYKKNPQKFEAHIYSKLLLLLQKISIGIIYLIYCACGKDG